MSQTAAQMMVEKPMPASSLHEAVKKGYSSLISYYEANKSKKEFNVDEKDPKNDNETALMLAVLLGDVLCVQFLLSNKAHPNAENKNGLSVFGRSLNCALKHRKDKTKECENYVNIVKLLLMDLRLTNLKINHQGLNAFKVAIHSSDQDILLLLKSSHLGEELMKTLQSMTAQTASMTPLNSTASSAAGTMASPQRSTPTVSYPNPLQQMSPMQSRAVVSNSSPMASPSSSKSLDELAKQFKQVVIDSKNTQEAIQTQKNGIQSLRTKMESLRAEFDKNLSQDLLTLIKHYKAADSKRIKLESMHAQLKMDNANLRQQKSLIS